MLFFGNKRRERYYLLPGMGGRMMRQKQRTILKWSIVVSVIFSVLLALLMYWFNGLRPFW